MKFYDILQFDPQITKNLIQKTQSKKEKLKLWTGMIIRSILIVLFAIIFISTLSFYFGNENTPMAVAIFCIFLGIRFVDFGYCIQDELINLAVTFLLLLIAPVIASITAPLLGFLINFISFFIILFMTCDKPEMGNGGLYSFAYIYLSGNPVYGEQLIQRFYLTVTGFILCALIFFIKHKNKNKSIRFIEKIKQMNLNDFKYHWMTRMSFGVSLILILGMIFHIERFMWAGFACGSLLSEYSRHANIKKKFIQRFIGVIAGSAIFYLLYTFIPLNLHSFIGPLGGFCLGLCVDYKYKTAVNCLGALMIASQLYGLEYSVILRIADTTIGIIFAFIFYYMYEKLIIKKVELLQTEKANIG